MENKGFIIIVFCCLFAFNGYGRVQTDTLKEVKVSRKSTPKSINPVQTLTSKQLEKTNSLTIADAVRHLSGVQLKDYGGVGGLKTINVRSLGSLHTGVFYDGIQLGNAQNGQIDLGKFSLGNIDSIELYNGQEGKQLLSARSLSLSSSLSIKSKRPVFKAGDKDQLETVFKTGSFGLVNPSLVWHHKINSNLYTSFSIELQKATGKYKFHYLNGTSDSLLTRENGSLNAYRGELGLIGITRDSSSWSIQTYAYGSDRGLPGFVARNKFTSKQQLWDNDFFIQASFIKKVSQAYQFAVRSKYGYTYNRYLDPEWLNAANKLENWYKQNEIYISLVNKYTVVPAFSLSLASDLIRNTMNAKIDASLDAFPKPVRTTALLAFSSELNLKGVNLTGSLLGTFVNESVKTGVSANNKNGLSPSLSLSWKPMQYSNLRVRGFFKDSFRLPTFNDQYYTLIGNTSLKPESTRQYDLGLTYQKALSQKLSYVSFRTDLFYNKVKDKIVALPTQSLFLWTMMNIGDVRIKGLEAGINSRVELNTLLSIDAGLNYTYQEALDVTPGGNNYNQLIPYSPKHAGSATISLDVKNYTLNYNYIYTGERYGLRPNNLESYMEPWYTHDASAAYTLNKKRVIYKLTAEVNNLFNQSYQVVRNYPMPGRSFRITLKINY